MKHGLILDRYKPLGVAGVGGFGTVEVAWDTRILRKVAIKTIELSESEEQQVWALQEEQRVNEVSQEEDDYNQEYAPDYAVNRGKTYSLLFKPHKHAEEQSEANAAEDELLKTTLSSIPGLDEARTAALLQDPNIVTVYDFEIQGNLAYLIMEYIEGCTLTEFLRDFSEDIDLDIIAAVTKDIAHALVVAHENNVLHLDIKPDNVLISPNGRIKVTDFGLATLGDAQGYGVAAGGTIGYMPLEQMQQKHLDERCDEWALASIVYEMLTGENPFLASTLEQAQKAIYESEIVLPSLCWEDMSGEIDDVMWKGLDPDPEKRYPTVAKFASAVQPFLGDEQKGHEFIVDLLLGEEPDEETPVVQKPHIPLRERITQQSLAVCSRVFVGVGSGALTLFACANIAALGGIASVATWGIALAVALAGALSEGIGVGLSFIAIGVSLCVNGAYLLGGLLCGVALVWWLFVGRFGASQANSVLACPVFGSFGAGVLGPLAAGVTQPVRDAICSALVGVFVCFVLAALGSGDIVCWNPFAYGNYASAVAVGTGDTAAVFVGGAGVGAAIQQRAIALLSSGEMWITAASWILAAAMEALLCESGRRGLRIAAVVIGFVVVFAGACVAAFLTSQGQAWLPAWQYIFAIAGSSLAVLVAVCMRQGDR